MAISQLILKTAFIVASISTYHNAITATKVCSSEFSTHPTNIIVMEGATATFTCSVSSFKQQTDKLTWVVLPPSIHQMNISEEYDPSTKEMISTLMLFNIGRRNQKTLCVLERSPVGREPQVCQSKSATFITWYFPGEDEISCGPKNLTAVEEAQPLTIWCKTNIGNPPVDLSWNMEGSYLPYTETFSNDSTIGISTNLTASDLDNKKTIHCVVSGSENFKNKCITCPIGPFRTYHEPQAAVNPPNVTITPSQHTVNLTCVVNANPETIKFLWSCTPSNLTKGCNTANENIELTLTQKSFSFLQGGNFITATCFVQTLQGMANASSRISLMNPSHQDGTFSSNCSDIQMTLEKLNETHDVNFYASFKCSVQGNTLLHGKQDIFWYYKNEIIQKGSEHSPSHSIQMYMESTIRLRVPNRSHPCNQLVCRYVAEHCSTASDPHTLCENTIIEAKAMKTDFPVKSITLIPISNLTTQSSFVQTSNGKQHHFVAIIGITSVLLSMLISLVSAMAVCKYLKHVHISELPTNSQSQLDRSHGTVLELQQQNQIVRQALTSSGNLEPVYEDPPLTIHPPLTSAEDNLHNFQYLYDSNLYHTTSSSTDTYASAELSSSPATVHGSFDSGSSLSSSSSSSSDSRDQAGRSGPFYENQTVTQMHCATHAKSKD